VHLALVRAAPIHDMQRGSGSTAAQLRAYDDAPTIHTPPLPSVMTAHGAGPHEPPYGCMPNAEGGCAADEGGVTAVYVSAASHPVESQ
jgi:hypothetical protein